MSGPPAATARSPRRVLPLVVALTGFGVLTFALIAPALPDLAEELNVSRGSIGLLQGAVAIPGIFLAIWMGYLSDLKGRRFVAVGSLILLGGGGVVAFFVRSFWPLVGLRGIQGIGTSGLLSLGVVVVGDLFSGNERKWALGINSAGITLTALVSPIIGGLLAEGGAFRPFLVYFLAAPLLLATPILPGKPTGSPPAPPLQHVRSMFRELRESGHLSDFAGLLPFSLVAMVVFVGFGFTVAPLYLETEFGLGSAERGLVQAVISVGSSFSTLNAARMARRFSPAWVLTAGFAGVTAGFVVIAAAPNLWIVGAGFLTMGLALGLLFPLIQDFVASSVATAFRGAAVGTWISSIRLGQSVGPVIGTGLAEGFGERTTFLVGAVLMAGLTAAWLPARRLAARWAGPVPEGYRSIQGISGPGR